MHLPIGIDNFRELILSKTPENPQGLVYVDKTLLIREVIEDSAKIIVLLRPRRFGKTLNLSMLQHFFAAEVDGESTAGLFDGLAIAREPAYMAYQGKSPVIFIGFKDVKEPTFDAFLKNIAEVIARTYREHEKLFAKWSLNEVEQNDVGAILEQRAQPTALAKSILRLSEILHKYYGVMPILLLDEYDTPLQTAYLKGYYEEAVEFMRNLLSSGLKSNAHLERAVLTGILRVAKESLLSGLSNAKVYSVLDEKYAEYFGFTQSEVDALLGQAQLAAQSDQVKAWYNGYNFGELTIYNPWSIINFIEEGGKKLKAYWINTGDNTLIKNLITETPVVVREKMATLLAGGTIWETINEHLVFNSLGGKDLDFAENQIAIWTLLLMAGYLTWVTGKGVGLNMQYELRIPNNEVVDYYDFVIKWWLIGKQNLAWYEKVLAALSQGNVPLFEEELQKWVMQTLSYHDVSRDNQESFYHGMLLAFVAGLRETHLIKSNKEAGDGRYDIALIPKDPKRLGIIIELKAVATAEGLDKAAAQALEQIKTHGYVTELAVHGVDKKVFMGIACAGKKLKIVAGGDAV